MTLCESSFVSNETCSLWAAAGHPDQVKNDDLSTFNMMTGEQTFSWLSRFKKMLSSAMQKNTFSFLPT